MNAVERMVVQTTLKEKQALIDKARHLKKSVSEWMHTGARRTRQPMGFWLRLPSLRRHSSSARWRQLTTHWPARLTLRDGATIPAASALVPSCANIWAPD